MRTVFAPRLSGAAGCAVVVMRIIRVRARPFALEADVDADLAQESRRPAQAGPPAPEGYRARSSTWRRARPPFRQGHPEGPRRFPSTPSAPAIKARTAAAIGSASITPSTASSRLPQ